MNIFVISGALPGLKEPTKNFIREVGLPTETKWSENYENNLYWNINFPNDFNIIEGVNLKNWQSKGYDTHALAGNPMFVDPANGNYQVEENSPALGLGFENFSMDQFGHQMTRMVPYGGEFLDEIKLTMLADDRADGKGKIMYTLDGSEPSIESLEYTFPLSISKTTIVKSKTFIEGGISIGFTTEASFDKVPQVTYPSCYTTLLAGKYEGEVALAKPKVLGQMLGGALLINIADDPDLIDATGGYNFGCYIQSIDWEKGKMWLDAQLTSDWVIQQINGKIVQNIADLLKYRETHKNEMVTIIAVRDYKEKKFKVKF